MHSYLYTRISLALLTVGSAHVTAQTISGSVFYTARCGPTGSGIPMNFGDDQLQSSHGACPDNMGGFGSVNDAHDEWHVHPGLMIIDSEATSDFAGTQAAAGTASAVVSCTEAYFDIVFSNIANPGQTGTIPVGGMHFRVGARTATLGVSNCSGARPAAQISFSLGLTGMLASGSQAVEPDLPGGSSTSGVFVGYANDGSLVAKVTNGADFSLTVPQRLDLGFGTSTDVLYCDFPPADLGDARAKIEWRLPCDGPVFDLPAGYTANSAQLGIVNNFYTGPACCPGDLNGDHVVDLADLAAIISNYGANPATRAMGDLNGDTVIDLADLALMLSNYGHTCI